MGKFPMVPLKKKKKKNHNWMVRVLMSLAVRDHYITSSSPVYLCFLDASKAFDRVNYW